MFSSLLKLKLKLKPKLFSSSSSSSILRCLCYSSSSPPQPQTQQALDFLRDFFRDHSDPNSDDIELSFVSALKACSVLSAVSPGRQIHSLVAKSGLVSNTFVANSLLSMYAKCGLVAEARSLFDSSPRLDFVSCNIMVSGYVRSGEFDNAREVFDKMPKRTCIVYTSLIMGFSWKECWRESLELFKQMRSEGILPCDVTMAYVISASLQIGKVWECRMLHGFGLKLDLLRPVFVSTNLLNMYCSCSSLESARALFGEMEEKNIISWNVMLNGYAKAGLVNRARKLFFTMPTKDVVSWGTMVDAFVQTGRLSDAVTTCCKMLRSGIRVNYIMVVDLISACGRAAAFHEGRELHCLALKEGLDCLEFVQATVISFYAGCGYPNLARIQFEVGFKDHVASWNSLIAGYIKNDMVEHAMKIFEEMPNKDVFTWTIMISGHAHDPKRALELFDEMVAKGIKANEITMVSVLSSISSLGLLAEGKRAHDYILDNAIPLNENLSAAIVDMYSKCGTVNTALEVFYQTRDRVSGISPWNAIICGLAVHGHGKLALEIFSDLLSRPMIKPNSITFIGVLSACCHSGLVKLGEGYFNAMKSVHNVDPDLRHYGCMVDLYGRAGQLKEADELIKRMPMSPDVIIWGTLLAACKTHGNLEIGEKAAKSLASLEPRHGPGRVMLSNIYADAGRWEESSSLRRDVMAQRMEVSTGRSGVFASFS